MALHQQQAAGGKGRQQDIADFRIDLNQVGDLCGRKVGELRYAVFAHRRFFSGGKAPKLEELSWIGFDESLRRVAIARWLATRLPGMRPRLRADSIIAIMHAAAAGIGAAALRCGR